MIIGILKKHDFSTMLEESSRFCESLQKSRAEIECWYGGTY